jgi:phage/plasmid-like protein (TIGR03299 family)
MAHELDMSNGQANMAFVGAVPWHGLGQQLTEDANLETWKREAGMDWQVNKSLLVFKDQTGMEHFFPDRNVLYRSDNKAALGVVSNDYRIVHPGEVMEFFRDLIEGHGFKMETAGCLFGGRKFWALARTGESVRIMGQDEIKPYLLMASSCDGSMATAVHLTSVRVVCNNTLRMSIGADASKAKIRVPHSAVFDAESVKQQLGIVGDAWENFIGNIGLLAKFKIDRDQAIQIVADELKAEWKDKEGNDMDQDAMLEASVVLRRIIKLYDSDSLGNDFRSSKGTAWGLVNAVTQYFDHETGGKGDKSRAFERAHLTDRAKFKTNIADRLLALAA